MSNEINVEELGRLAKAATPGPWRWEFNATHKRLHLVGGRPQYDLTIMDFDRWGMGGAVATLRDTSEDGMNIMYRLCDRPDWIAPFAGRAHHAGWCSDVTHPDMRLIATANPSTILSLIDRMKKAEAELERERMRLAACGVVALADTPESAAKAREMRDEYRSASCDDVARRVDECMTLRAERDALAAKLAELEGQEPTAWMNAKRDMASFIRFHEDDLPLFARPVPAEEGIVTVTTNDAGRCVMVSRQDEDHRILSVIWEAKDVPTEPVNARLLSALIQCRDRFVFYVGHHLDKGDMGKAAENEKFVALANEAISAAEAQQDRLLQDMHDAGREIDRVMAEATPKAARLTDEEIASLLAASDKNSPRVPSFFMTEPHKFARVIETAAIRKNGLAMED